MVETSDSLMEITFHCTDEINLNMFLIYVFQLFSIKYLALVHAMCN
jgi:hypothetical protein